MSSPATISPPALAALLNAGRLVVLSCQPCRGTGELRRWVDPDDYAAGWDACPYCGELRDAIRQVTGGEGK